MKHPSSRQRAANCSKPVPATRRRAAFCGLSALLLGAIPAGPAHGAPLTWDANTATAGAQDGAGTWSTTSPNWYNGTATDVVWPNDTSTAVFGAGTAGTYAITVGTVNAGGIIFNQTGYTLSGGTITLNPGATTTPFVYRTNGGTSTVGTGTTNTNIASAGGQLITKTGVGTLVIGGNGGGGAANTPALYTITGGTFSSSTGLFDSVLSMVAGNRLGNGNANAAAAATNPQVTLDAGTIQLTQSVENGNNLADVRGVRVTANGGAINDAGATGAGTQIPSAIINNAGTNTSLYLSNRAGFFTKFSGVISGTGSLTWNGPGTGILSAINTYSGGTVVNQGTLQLTNGSLGSNNVTVASGATLAVQGGVFKFDLSNPSDRLAIQGNFTINGTSNIRLNTGSLTSITPGTYPLISAAGSTNLGAFQIDGGTTVTVPAQSMIKQLGGTPVANVPGNAAGNVGGTFYRFTLQSGSNSEQVVVTPAPTRVVTIMPLGASITEGVSADSANTGGGYRSQMYQMFVNDGRFSPNFVGSRNVLDVGSAPAGNDVLSAANQLFNEGHGGYTTTNVLTNLNANAGTGSNDGGFWLAPGNGVNPEYITVNVGGNDYTYNNSETIGPVNRVDAILTYLQTLRPASNVVLSNLLYRYDVGALETSQYNPRVPGVIYNHVLAGHHVVFADAYGAVTPNDSLALLSSDRIHPSVTGYPVLGVAFYNPIVYGSAYWTGAQNGQWNTVAAGSATNFAFDYQLTTDRQKALDASTDVYFNRNTAALPTTLGQDIAVRGVNFASGATGPVTVGGANTLTLGVGGVTVQNGTGTHTISANVALAANQTWGNVSANPFTVSGNVSGAYGLTTTGSYTIQAPVSATSGATTTQTYTGTGAIVLAGANTYSGGTTLNGGTLVVRNLTGSGTGSGAVTVGNTAVLTDNGAVGGDVSVRAGGTVNGNGAFGGSVQVSGAGTFSAAGTISGALNVDAGGYVLLTGGMLTVNGGVVNNGTLRLGRGASLAVANGGTLTNNGILDIITGSFSAPSGFTNNGTVIDSSVVQVSSVQRAGNTVALTVNSYTGHTYQLQRSDSLASGSFTNLGASQNGSTGTVLTFTDNGATAAQGFYRVQVDLPTP